MNLTIINFAVPKTGNFFADVILWLCNISSSIVVGIVLFTLLLKLITLPFDYVSRASMRKNSIKMEEMRPELERLQKQYADNKDLYNQKMMALYKKNGYSMFGSCLPTILTLVFFIIALNGFTVFSQYQNRQYFYEMSNAFNNVVYAGMEIDTVNEDPYIYRNKTGKIKVDVDRIWDINFGKGTNNESELVNDGTTVITATKAIVNTETQEYKLTVKSNNSYVVYERSFNIKDDGSVFWGAESFKISYESLMKTTLINEENNQLKNNQGKTFNEYIDSINTAENPVLGNTEKENQAAYDFITDIQQVMSAKKYRSQDDSRRFLWVKNVWVTDSPMSHPIESSWAKFRDTHAYPTTKANNVGAEKYKLLIGHLDTEKTAPNGYFILVVLTAGISLLMQLVMSKSQKAQMELQTVDGQGAQTQKIMTVMMPIMMAIFAFMYTSAFSIYIILSNIMSMATTFGINKIVDHKVKKEKEKEGKDNTKIRGRVYVPKEEPKQENTKDNKKKKDTSVNDGFLSGKADKNKHVRGRLK